ncbi:MAG: hypothetical protein V7K45_23480 [Nostoc sp.]
MKLWQVTQRKETYSCLRSQRTYYTTIAFTQANNQSNPVIIGHGFLIFDKSLVDGTSTVGEKSRIRVLYLSIYKL